MAVSVHVPRVNNNDDEVKLVGLQAAVGDRVARGQIIAQVETDKAVLDVEAPGDGFVLGVQAAVDDIISVGSVLIWLGERTDEAIPVEQALESVGLRSGAGQPTAKARRLLRDHGLSAEEVPHDGERLTVEDIERHLAGRDQRPAPVAPRARESLPQTAGRLVELRNDERGMLATVTWHRDVAAPGYIEMEYDPAPWEAYSKAFAERHRLLLGPLLSLMSWRLVELAREMQILNSTIVGSMRYEFSTVNLGFTVQAGETLYLAVARNAGALDEAGFVHAMGELQRRATTHKLGPQETQGATIGFSSMSRWKVSRHIPVLPPQTALMVAHAVSGDGRSVLGASYDHRVLNGFHVVTALRKLSKPGQSGQSDQTVLAEPSPDESR